MKKYIEENASISLSSRQLKDQSAVEFAEKYLIAAGNMRKSPLRQRLGDEWAHTVVLKRRDLQPNQLRSGGRFIIVFLGAVILNGIVFCIGQLLKIVG